MDLSRYISELKGLVEGPYVAGGGRPDADYVGQAYKRHDIPSANGFPYEPDDDGDGYLDATRPDQIGQDRGAGRREPNHNILTPKDTAHTQWATPGQKRASRFEEASGTPINFTQSGRGGQQLGGSMPGGGRGWSGNPTKPWDEDDEEDELAQYGKDALESVDPEAVPNQLDPSGLEPDQGEDYDFTDFPSVLLQVVGSGFGTGLGKDNPSGRGFMTGWNEDLDMMALESAWAALAKMFGFPS